MSNHAELNRTGDKMPMVGFGCWKVENNIAEQLIYDAIKAGYVSFPLRNNYEAFY